MPRKKRDRLPRREQVFEAAVAAPTILALVWASSHALDPLSSEEVRNLIVWVAVTASVELIPVPLWRGTIISMGFPLLMVVAFLYPPAAAGAAAFLAASDPRELRREIGPLRALFNRSQIGLAVWGASAVFHTLITDIEGASTPLLLAAALL